MKQKKAGAGRNDIYAALDEHQPGDVVKAYFFSACPAPLLALKASQVKLLRPDKPDELGGPHQPA